MEETKKIKALVTNAQGFVYFIPKEMTAKEEMEYRADLRESEK